MRLLSDNSQCSTQRSDLIIISLSGMTWRNRTNCKATVLLKVLGTVYICICIYVCVYKCIYRYMYLFIFIFCFIYYIIYNYCFIYSFFNKCLDIANHVHTCILYIDYIYIYIYIYIYLLNIIYTHVKCIYYNIYGINIIHFIYNIYIYIYMNKIIKQNNE